MKHVWLDEEFLPDVIATSCVNSLNLKNVDFKVPCGKCIPCQRKRRGDWAFRLEQEYLDSDSAFFVTLTYTDFHIPRTKEHIPTLRKKDLQNYIKRLRNDHVKYVSEQLNIKKNEVKKVSKPIRYYAVGEYGSKTRRPHYHMLIFNYDIANLAPITDQWKCTATNTSLGFTDIGTVTQASINYVTKYMFKPFSIKDLREKPFSIMSKKPIIGHAYLEKYGAHHIKNEDLTVRDMKGNVKRLPKAFLHRLFTNKEDRIQVSLNSYQEYKDNKVKEYYRTLEKHYNGDSIKYSKSLDNDFKRQLQQINNKETL